MNKTFTGKRQIGKTTQMLESVARDFNPLNDSKILCVGFNAPHTEKLVKLMKGELMNNNPYGLNAKSINYIVEGVSIESYLDDRDIYEGEFQYIVLDDVEVLLQKIFPTTSLYSTRLEDGSTIHVSNPFLGDIINKKFIKNTLD